MLAHRLDGIAPTIFSQMSALAIRTGSVNLGQGFPDTDGPPTVIARAVAAPQAGRQPVRPGPRDPRAARAIAATRGASTASSSTRTARSS